MDCICADYFVQGFCNAEGCPHAHRLAELSNPEHWVLFNAPGLEMLDFLPYKLQSHHYFKIFSLPVTGPIVRFATPDDALMVVRDFQNYYSPAHLPAVLAQPILPMPQIPRLLQQLSPDIAALDALCRHELRFLKRGITRDSRAGSVATSGCSTPLTAQPQRVLNCSFDTDLRHSGSCDELSSECPSSESSPATPLSRSLSPASPGSASSRRNTAQRPDRSAGIIGVLRAHAARGSGFIGWTALKELWGIVPAALDEAVLTYLARKTPAEQEQILLSFAAIDLGAIQNLSAYLNCLIKEHETTSQVCLHFLAGLCPHHDNCRYIHPTGTAGWALLAERWGITYMDFDYAVLNYLSKKPVDQQDEILTLFADMNLKAVKNRSAYLSSMVERYERVGLRKRARGRGSKATLVGAPVFRPPCVRAA